MKQLNFSDGLEEYRLNGRVAARVNPTGAGFRERLSGLCASANGLPVWANLLLAVTEEVEGAMQGGLQKRETRIAKYTAKYKKQQSRRLLLCKG